MARGDVESGRRHGDDEEVEISRACYGCCCLGVSLVLLLLVILLPLSFSTLEYYQYGLVQSRATSKVFLEKVYRGGRHALGPDKKFRTFPADAQVVTLTRIDAVSADKLNTYLDVVFVYFLNGPQLTQLKKDLDKSYSPVVQATALATVKNTAVSFLTLEYFQNRTTVEDTFTKAVQTALKPLYVTVPLFYLQGVSIPDQVAAKQLQTAIQLQNNQQQIYASQAAVIRAETGALVNQIENNASLIIQTASANSTKIVANAQTESQQIVSTARNSGLSTLYSELGITSATDKTSLDYVRALTQNTHTNLHVGFQTQILGDFRTSTTSSTA